MFISFAPSVHRLTPPRVGKLESLKHVKKDIDEARKGSECGIGFETFQDFEVGDQIQSYEEIVTKRSL